MTRRRAQHIAIRAFPSRPRLRNVRGIECVEIAVRDVTASARWYQECLGFASLAGAPEGTCALDAGPALLRLVGPASDAEPRPISHVGFKVCDIDRHSERLHDAGVDFTMEPTDAPGDVRIAFFVDPDGNSLEFVEGVLRYHRTWSPELAAAEQASLPGTDDGAWFDHVAVTVGDLDASLAFYRDTLGLHVVGQLFMDDDRGAAITYVKAGQVTLELFSADESAHEDPPASALGVRAIGIAVDGGPARLPVIEPNGIPLEFAHGATP